MDMTTHHLMGRHLKDLFQLLKHNDLMSPRRSRPCINLDASSNFLFPFVPGSSLLWMRSELLQGSSWRSDSNLLKSRVGRTLFSCLLLDDPNPSLPKTGERLVLLRLDTGVHLLVELGHHLCKKKREIFVTPSKGKRLVNKVSLDQLTFLLSSNSTKDAVGRLWT